MKAILLILLLLLFTTHSPVQAQSVSQTSYYPMLSWDSSPFASFRFQSAELPGEFMNFRMLFPNGYDSAENQHYPLILMLHGSGESARMDWKKKEHYPADDPRFDNNDHQLFYGGQKHLEAVESGRFPGFVVFPQNFYGTWVSGDGNAESNLHRDLQKALELINYMVKELHVDRSRIYVHGLSNGAAATWYAAYIRPDLFAAALPMSASGDPAMAEELAHVPLWVFQGADDTHPPSATTLQTVEAVREADGSVRYTVYEETGHNTWNRAYNEPDFFEWMLARRGNQYPSVNAGEDQTLILPENSTSFTATASDPDGSISSWSWEQVEGPEAAMQDTTNSTLLLDELEAGSYLFRLTVRDNEGAAASDEVALQVHLTSGFDEKHGFTEGIELKAFPNPFQETVYLEIVSGKKEELAIWLMNSYGAKIYLEKTFTQFKGEHPLRMDLSALQLDPGLYFIHVQTTSGSYKKVFPLLKQ